MRPRLSGVAALTLLLALSAIGLSPAVADNPASGPTTSGQDLNVKITGPGGTLPIGTTGATVTGLVSLGEAPTTEAHVSFVIDDSGSMRAVDFANEKAGAYSMLTKLEAIPHLQVYASLIFFETAVTVAVSDRLASTDTDNDGVTDFKEALDARAHVAAATYTKNAVQAGINQLNGKSGIKQMYLITDGVPSPSSQNPAPLASTLTADNIQVYTYAIGQSATCSVLASISTKCTPVSSFDALPSTITDQTVAGVAGVQVKVNGGDPVDATIGGLGDFSAAVTGLHGGTNTVEATATATDGTMLTASSTIEVGEKPTVEITAGPGPGYQNDPTASWSFSSPAEDLAADPYACKIDGGAYAPCVSPFSATLADGSHTFSVTATDLDGDVSDPATSDVRIDTAAPVVAIASGPQGTVDTSTAHLTFTVTEANPGTTECFIDGEQLQTCTSPVDLSDLPNGEHTFEVVATDAAGKTGRDSRTWTVNTRKDNTISFASVADQVLPAGSVALAANATSGTVQLDSLTPDVCEVSGSSATLLSTGTCTIVATSPQTDHYYEASPVTQSFQVSKAPQSITFTQPGDTVYNGPDVPLSASSSSMLPVGLTSLTPSVCTVLGTSVHAVAAGTCEISASQDGNAGYDPADPVVRTLQVTKAAQSITFTQPGDTVYGGADVPLSASSSSLLPVELTSLTPSVCTVLGTTAHPVAAGTCKISASQNGSANYDPADAVVRTLTIAKAEQTITFTQPTDTVFEGADVPLTASSTSGLPVTLTSATPATCSIAAAKAHPTGAGQCTVTASQAGNDNYLPATSVTRSLTIAKAPITVTTSSSSSLRSLLTWRITYTSVVRSATTGLPVAGVPVTTRIGGGLGSTGCTAVTNSSGVATCTSGPIAIALFTTYRATASETANYLGGEAMARTPLL